MAASRALGLLRHPSFVLCSKDRCPWLFHLVNRTFANRELVPGWYDPKSVVKPELSRRQPYVKNLFLGKCDKDVLTYPEVLKRKRLKEFQKTLDKIEKYFEENVDSLKIDKEGIIPSEIMKDLGEMGLFGSEVPASYGGLDSNATEYARLREITNLDGSIGLMLDAHQALGIKGILLYGNEQQKAKYLPDLASGKKIAAFCVTEENSGSDVASMGMTAQISPDAKHYILKGKKQYVTNGGIADIFTVFAKVIVDGSEDMTLVTAFLVERDFNGVRSGNPLDKLGMRAANTAEVVFDNVMVPVENVLGDVDNGYKIVMGVTNRSYLGVGSAGAAVLRKLIGVATKHIINRRMFKKSLAEFHLVQEKLSKMAVAAYTMESLTFLTAGLLDTQDNPDCEVELAILKIFSSEALWNCVNECMGIFGGHSYAADSIVQLKLRDSKAFASYQFTNEILRIFLSLMCIQHTSSQLKESIQKLRNPLMYPADVLKRTKDRFLYDKFHPKLDLHLYGHLHPSLLAYANQLESGIKKLQQTLELVLLRNGNKVVDKQFELKRLADMAIDLYAMTAVLGRASRAYCIGLPHSDLEMILAETFCIEADQRIIKNMVDTENAPFANTDVRFTRITEHLCQEKGYCISHPTMYNF